MCCLLRRDSIAALVAVVTTVVVAAPAAVLDLTTTDGRLELPQFPTPPAFSPGVNDFTLTLWLRRTTSRSGQVSSVLEAGTDTCFTIHIDDATNDVRFAYAGLSGAVEVALPLHDADGNVPVDEWMLLACAWDTSGNTLTAFAQSESAALVAASAGDADETFASAWPMCLGSRSAMPACVGQYGLLCVRTHLMNVADFNLLWNNGAPNYFAPLRLETGSFNGVPGASFMVGHGVSTAVNKITNINAIGAELGDTVNQDNLLVYVDFGVVNYFSVGNVDSVTGTWTFRSPHEVGAAHAGFFVRETPDLSIGKSPWVEQVAPLTRQMADRTPEQLIRTICSANSRAVRVGFSYDDGWENWAYGGLFLSRQSQIAGAIVPAWTNQNTPWPGFAGSGRFEGEVFESTKTPYASIAFGNFGSHGGTNNSFNSYYLAGRALVIEPGSAAIPKARPEPGTLFADATQPLTVRSLLLRFPGAGNVTWQGEKATTQSAAGTLDGVPNGLPLDTSATQHTITASDVIDEPGLTMTLDGVNKIIQPGHACFISAGEGMGGITMITTVDTSSGTSTELTFEQWFPISPVHGSSLEFGPVETIWVEHAWPGLDGSDPQVFRGIRLEAADGIVVALFHECFNPDANGLIIGGIGRSGAGYAVQLNSLFTTGGIPMLSALQADVWLQFFADQTSTPSSMADYAAQVRAALPDVELWWCGDPDLDTLIDDEADADEWHAYIFDNATLSGVGAVDAHEHPSVGTGNERAADGQTSGLSHLTSRGNMIYMEATLEVLSSAALPGVSPCPADCSAPTDGQVDVVDLLALLAAWGTADACDIVGVGDTVDVVDLLELLANWGSCR